MGGSINLNTGGSIRAVSDISERAGRGEPHPGNALKARGIAVARDPTEHRELLGVLSGDVAMAAAPACTDSDDFRRRIGEQGAPRGGYGPGAPSAGRTRRSRGGRPVG